MDYYDGRVVVIQKQTLDLNTGRFTAHLFTRTYGYSAGDMTTNEIDYSAWVQPILLTPVAAPAGFLSFTNPYAGVIARGAAPSLIDATVAPFAPSASAVTADGLSAAVAVYRATPNGAAPSDASAPVTFSLEGGSPLSLSPYTSDFLSNPHPGGAGQVTVSPAFCVSSTNNTCYFLALVWAPQIMPVSTTDLAAGHFSPVIAQFTATQLGRSVHSSLEVLPPPVAMVHGVWSGVNAWSPFNQWITQKYPHRLLGLVDYTAFNSRSFADPSIQSALQTKITDLLLEAANDGQVARSVDVIGHSMGGLATRWFMTHAPSNLPNAVHKLIGVGTPNQGSNLATQLWLNKDSLVTQTGKGLTVAAICTLRSISPCTLGNVMASQGRTVAGAVTSLQPTSNEINQVNATASSYKAIVGLAPSSPKSVTELELDLLAGGFIPGATVGSILGPAHDTIVSTASQQGNAQDSATINGIVHAAAWPQDVDETSSSAVWAQALYWLMGGTGTAPVASSSTFQLTNVPVTTALVASAPPPVFDLTGLTQVPATNVTFTPATNSSLAANSTATINATSGTKTITEIFFFQAIVDPTDVSVLYATQLPFSVTFTPKRLGFVDLAAFAVFSDKTYAATSLRYSVQTSGVLNSLVITSAPVASLPVGTSTKVRTTANFNTGSVEVTATATSKARSGSAAVFSVGAGGLVTANGPGIDWLDVSYGGQTVSVLIRVGSCTFALSPVNQIVPNTGGITTIQVTAPPGCAWTAATTDPWLNLTSFKGTGNGSINLTATGNASATSRVGTVSVDDQNAVITQPNQSCVYTVTPTQINAPAAGSNGTISVSTSCPITLASSADWLLPTNLGSSVAYAVVPNPSASPRTAILTVGSKTVSFTQLGSLQLLLDDSVPGSNKLPALNSVLFLGDPFPVIDAANLFNHTLDRNTRVIIFLANLQLAQGETASSVVVNLVDANNKSYDVAAEDVRPVPNFEFTQVIFRLPDNLSVGTCTIKVKAHGEVSNAGTIRIRI